jgi:hypothetical protein
LGEAAGVGWGAARARAEERRWDVRWMTTTISDGCGGRFLALGLCLFYVVLLVCANTGIIDMYRGLKTPTAF